MLLQAGLTVETGNSALLHEPWTVQTRRKGWFRVFSPFWRACRAGPQPAAPLVAPQSLTPCTDSPAGLQLYDFDLRPRQTDWDGLLADSLPPGADGAAALRADCTRVALPRARTKGGLGKG